MQELMRLRDVLGIVQRGSVVVRHDVPDYIGFAKQLRSFERERHMNCPQVSGPDFCNGGGNGGGDSGGGDSGYSGGTSGGGSSGGGGTGPGAPPAPSAALPLKVIGSVVAHNQILSTNASTATNPYGNTWYYFDFGINNATSGFLIADSPIYFTRQQPKNCSLAALAAAGSAITTAVRAATGPANPLKLAASVVAQISEYSGWAAAGEITVAELLAGVGAVLTGVELLALLGLAGAALSTIAGIGAYVACAG